MQFLVVITLNSSANEEVRKEHAADIWGYQKTGVIRTVYTTPSPFKPGNEVLIFEAPGIDKLRELVSGLTFVRKGLANGTVTPLSAYLNYNEYFCPVR
ncbi:MAG: hypothetical protein JNN15_09925 [Blastocatellia bacterium]|nr:hypothetical protein [Blastocatellia bacterium]